MLLDDDVGDGVVLLEVEAVGVSVVDDVVRSIHELLLTAATFDEYLPTSHDVQASEPFADLYSPAPHAMHVPPSSPVYPALHLQSVALPLPGADHDCMGHATHVLMLTAATTPEYVPPAHSTHAPDPFSALYVPITHASHCPPSGPVYPVLHLQSVTLPLPGSEDACKRQERHVLRFPDE